MDQHVIRVEHEDETNLEGEQNTYNAADTVTEVQQSMNEMEPAAVTSGVQEETENQTLNTTEEQKASERKINADLKMGQIVRCKERWGDFTQS